MTSVPRHFHAVPLTDFRDGELYLGKYPGFLYDASNQMPLNHDMDGRAIAAGVVPLDRNGNPRSNGKIVALAIGMSNWKREMRDRRKAARKATFLSLLAESSRVNSRMRVVNGAQGGAAADSWINDSSGCYTEAEKRLAAMKLTPAQVQIVLYKNANKHPSASLTADTQCSAGPSLADACLYGIYVAEMARYVKRRYCNVKQLFLHSRIFAGYAAAGTLNPEPFAYEYGFATKWIIQSQINQIKSGTITEPWGDLGYSAVPWMAWGPYFWASGTTSRGDGLIWLQSDYDADMTHPGPSACRKVAGMMLNFYLTSPHAPWFRAGE